MESGEGNRVGDDPCRQHRDVAFGDEGISRVSFELLDLRTHRANDRGRRRNEDEAGGSDRGEHVVEPDRVPAVAPAVEEGEGTPMGVSPVFTLPIRAHSHQK